MRPHSVHRILAGLAPDPTFAAAALLALAGMIVQGTAARAAEAGADAPARADAPATRFTPDEQISHGSVAVAGRRIDYEAHAGTLVVHSKDWDRVPQNAAPDEDKNPRPEGSMFYVAYFESAGADGSGAGGSAGRRRHERPGAATAAPSPATASRPITFLYNGGPGAASMWLHLGAFGPRRVLTADATHTPAAPYRVVDNEFSLLDASDLVFIDAPGTGLSRIAGKEADKAFYGVDADARAFADFIVQFLSKYGRWNSPKYLFGESYGTMRSAALVDLLETERKIDFNGVIQESQILNYDDSPDGPESNPGVDLAYELVLPSYAATAWYHHRLPDASGDLAALLSEVEGFALTDYAQALLQGSELSAPRRAAVAEKLHQYTGLPVDYILKANLRISGPEFEQALERDADTTVGRLDARFSGPSFDPLAKEAGYDPLEAALYSAYVSAINAYLRNELHYQTDREFIPLSLQVNGAWNFRHRVPDSAPGDEQWQVNVMPDLARAMKYDPRLHVMLIGGYFDLGTPFFAATYELRHLNIPDSVRRNIEYAYYPSGHMLYAHEAALEAMHRQVADFIRRTSAPVGPADPVR